jgi:hypothetical protein
VTLERSVIEMDGKTIPGRIARLIHKGFFEETKTVNAVIKELRRMGLGFADKTVYNQCAAIAEMGFLTKEAEGYLAVPDMKTSIVEAGAKK